MNTWLNFHDHDDSEGRKEILLVVGDPEQNRELFPLFLFV